MKEKVKAAFGALALTVLSSVASAQSSGLQAPYFVMSEKGKALPILSSVSSEANLKSFFGPKHVVRKAIGVGEGETEPGNVVFPDKPLWRASITWKNPVKRDEPASIRIEETPSTWCTNSGITTGMSLKQLETMNGKPFKLAGFEWDYGGTVYSWEGGKLEKQLKSKNGKFSVTVRLGAPAGKSYPDALAGDQAFLSSDPRMQKLNPVIYTMLITAN